MSVNVIPSDLRVQFSLHFTGRTGEQIAAPQNVRFTWQTHSKRAEWGPMAATVRADGDIEALKNLTQWLSYHVTAYNGQGEPFYWGYIEAVGINEATAETRFGLPGTANRIAVQYTMPGSSAGQQFAARTTFADDTDSQARYGIIEKILTANSIDATGANAARAAALEGAAYPAAATRLPQQIESQPYVTMMLRGYYNQLDWLYHTNDSGEAGGRIAHEVTTDEKILRIGWARTGTFNFAASSMTEEAALMAFDPDDVIVITGTSSNNGIKKVASQAGGNIATFTTTVTTESGANATLTYLGEMNAQSFTTTGAFRANSVQIRAQKIGAPSDNLLIELRTNSSGAPTGTVLATATLTPEMISGGLRWYRAILSSEVALSASTTYWLVIRRSGANSHTDYYQIGVDTAAGFAGGTLAHRNNAASTWVNSGASYWGTLDMLFTLVGVAETSAQIAQMITARFLDSAQGVFNSVVVRDASGVFTDPYQSGDTTGLTIAAGLLSNGQRLSIDHDRNVYVENYPPNPGAGNAPYVLRRNGVFSDRERNPVNVETLPAVFWYDIEELLDVQPGIAGAASPQMIIEHTVQYNGTGFFLSSITPLGRKNPLDINAILDSIGRANNPNDMFHAIKPKLVELINGAVAAVGVGGAGNSPQGAFMPMCRAYNSANISIATGGSVKILTFNSERYDTAAMHSTSTNTSRITFPVAGVYHVFASVAFAGNATGQRVLNLRVDGATVIASHSGYAPTANTHGIVVATDYYFTAGQYVECTVFQDSGGALNVNASGNFSPEFGAHFVGVV